MQINCFQSFFASARCARLCKIVTYITWPESSELIAILYIERPTNLTARSLTWSYYASSNTVKYWHNTTWHNTKGWGGHTSYRHVIENSGFLKYLIYADTVMADCWFNIARRGCWYVLSWNPPPSPPIY